MDVALLRRRAEWFAKVRAFFAERGVLEVDTPLLGSGVVVEATIDPIPCQVQVPGGARERFLLTSPEAPMKRLLAAGSGPIYQLAHAFRDGELGPRHEPEFTLLEWYRTGFDHHALMDEVEALVRALLPSLPPTPFARDSYRSLFRERAGVDPFATSVGDVGAACRRNGVALPDGFEQGSLDDALDLLLVTVIEPTLGTGTPQFVTDYPASQAALARIHTDRDGHRAAERFELYLDGIELANGYHELLDAPEQRERFTAANRARQAAGRPQLPADEALLSALARGVPPCAGVALGFDRLLMAAGGADRLDAVRPFPFD